MSYKVTWTFGDGASESQTFDNEDDARMEAHQRSGKYAQQYDRCGTQLHDSSGQLLMDLTETYYS